MKFGIDKGHNCRFDTGASGIRFEDDLTREVGNKVIDKLRALGHVVTDCTPATANSLEESLYLRSTVANRDNVDMFASLHFNCGGGRGTEVYAMSDKGREIAQMVLNNIVALGYVNRGVKDGSHLYVIKNTNAPAVLIESSFVDSAEDMSRYNAEYIANAIVEGLTGQVATNASCSGGVCQIPIQPQFAGDNKVLKLQKVLNRLKIRDGKGNVLAEDGIIGSCTKEATKRLQTICGLEVDGIAGPATWGTINQILDKPLLEVGSTGIAVRYLQYKIGTAYDGIFGNNTKNAVIRFQDNNELDADGIVGNNTWSKLIG